MASCFPYPAAVPLLYILIGIAAASLGWSAYVRRAYHRPLFELRQAMKRQRRGEAVDPVEPRGADPVRKAGHRLNQMLDEVAREMQGAEARKLTLTALVDALPDAVLLAGDDDAIQLVNRPAAELLTIDPDAVLGQPAAAVLVDRPLLKLFDRAVRRKRGARREGPNTRRRQITLTRDGRSRTFDAVVKLTPTGNVLVVLRDVSTLAGAARMKTDFVANASHELRTPLSAMGLAVESLDAAIDDGDAEQQRRSGRVIATHLDRLTSLVADLLDLGAVESAEGGSRDVEELTVAEALAPHVATFAALAEEKGVALDWPSEQGGRTLRVDRRLLDLIVKNLVENAVKYTPAGGSVTVGLDGPRLTVRDTGVGIPAALQDRVFERFFQVDDARTTHAGRGTGLGLSIVKHAAGAMGADVTLSSREGEGTTVTLTLPT